MSNARYSALDSSLRSAGPSKTLTAEELRQSLLSQIDATKEAVYELSDEEVEQVAGGIGSGTIVDRLKTILQPTKPERLPGLPGPEKRIPGRHEPQPPRPFSPSDFPGMR